MALDEWEEIDDLVCPACGASPLRRQECSCDDGWLSGYDEDPLWYDLDEMIPCTECNGVGYHLWCPTCGKDMTQPEWREAINAQERELEARLAELYGVVG